MKFFALATVLASAAAALPSEPRASGFKFLGVSESVAEFGTAIPGTWGVDFYFPSTSAIQTLRNEGYNTFRIPFLLERMVPSSLTGAFDANYLRNFTAVVNFVTNSGGYAVLDPHNYGRYKNNVISNTNDFQTFWRNFAAQYSGNSRVIFDTNNEYHDMDQTLVYNLNQAAINGIRASGATSQYIFVEGNSWTGAWTWTTTNTNLVSLTDPQNKIIYEMHQYLDSDGSGTGDNCVSGTIGAERLASATAWLKANKKLGVIGEFAGGANPTCLQAVTGLLDHLKANTDVWTGALIWAAGPWWGTNHYSFEPPSGTAYRYYDATLRRYTP